MGFEISLLDLFSNDEDASRVLIGLRDGVVEFECTASPAVGTATTVVVQAGGSDRAVRLRGTVIARGLVRPAWVRIEISPASAAELSRLTLLIRDSLCSTEESALEHQAFELPR